ncbi:unnamed protein product [Closterium sp. NIES-64]|nr:unnamed protein product [Closterium sp. NIES-64]
MGGMGVSHGGAGDLHDQAYATLSNPILLWGLWKRLRLTDALLATESSEIIRAKLTPAVGVKTAVTTTTSVRIGKARARGGAPDVQVESLKGLGGWTKGGGVRGGAQPTLDAGTAGWRKRRRQRRQDTQVA